MNWNHIISSKDIEELTLLSFDRPVLLFKHSNSCSISSIAKLRIEKDWTESIELTPYLIDVKALRSTSDLIAEEFDVYHESPQILLISNGQCVFDTSHMDISMSVVNEELLELT